MDQWSIVEDVTKYVIRTELTDDFVSSINRRRYAKAARKGAVIDGLFTRKITEFLSCR